MRPLTLAATALFLLGASPVLAMSCCGAAKGKAAMCGRPGTAMGQAGTKGRKGCCCDGMAAGMSRRG